MTDQHEHRSTQSMLPGRDAWNVYVRRPMTEADIDRELHDSR